MHFFSLLAAASAMGLAVAAPSKLTKRAGKMQWVGVNESGPEFGDGIFPGLYGKEVRDRKMSPDMMPKILS